jgi:hypothetical protein
MHGRAKSHGSTAAATKASTSTTRNTASGRTFGQMAGRMLGTGRRGSTICQMVKKNWPVGGRQEDSVD